MNKHGQHMIEFVLLFVAVVSVLILFLRTDGPMHATINNMVINAPLTHLNRISDEIKF